MSELQNSSKSDMNSDSKVQPDENSDLNNRKRHRRLPNRYGDFGQLDLSDSFDDVLNLCDNSLEDLTFVPEEEPIRKVVASIRRIGKPLSKKMKADIIESDERNLQNETDQCDQDIILNFDEEFDSSDTSQSERNKSSSIFENHSGKIDNPNSLNVSIPDEMSNIDKNGDEKVDEKVESEVMLLTSTETTHIRDMSQDVSKDTEFLSMLTESPASNEVLNICRLLLSEFRQNSRETLARISVMEDAMRKNGSLDQMAKKSSIANNIEEIRIFGLSNHLPLKNIDDLMKFEDHLRDVEFKKVAVS